MPARPSRLVLSALAIAMLAGCSRAPASGDAASPSVDPSYLLSQAKANATSASSVHMRGTGQCDLGGFVVDMDLRKDGLGGGSVQVDGQTINVVSTSDAVYLHASPTFWSTQLSSTDAKRVGDKWVKVAKGASPCLTALSSFSLAMANYLDYPGPPTLLQGDQVQGTPAHLVGLGDQVSMWIASRGTLLPVNVHDLATSTDITWSDWDSDVAVVVPRAASTIDGRTLAPA